MGWLNNRNGDRYLPVRAAGMVLFLSLLFSAAVHSRPELGPPSIKLRTNLSNIVVAELTDISAEHRLSFSVVENLHNEAEQSVVIRSDSLTSARLVEGKTYIIAYVGWDVDRFPRVTKPRRNGAVIINLDGAAPAIFQPNDDLVSLLRWDLKESLESPDEMLSVILRGMAESDPHLQSFFTTELVTRPGLHSRLTPTQKRTVAGYLVNSGYSPQGRSLMLGHVPFRDWLLEPEQQLEVARRVLEHHPIEIGFGSPYGGLVRSAMFIMQKSENLNDAVTAQRWLTSNQPALVESAAAVIYAVNPDILITALEQAAGYSLLEKQSRQALENLLQRYRRSVAVNRK